MRSKLLFPFVLVILMAPLFFITSKNRDVEYGCNEVLTESDGVFINMMLPLKEVKDLGEYHFLEHLLFESKLGDGISFENKLNEMGLISSSDYSARTDYDRMNFSFFLYDYEFSKQIISFMKEYLDGDYIADKYDVDNVIKVLEIENASYYNPKNNNDINVSREISKYIDGRVVFTIYSSNKFSNYCSEFKKINIKSNGDPSSFIYYEERVDFSKNPRLANFDPEINYEYSEISFFPGYIYYPKKLSYENKSSVVERFDVCHPKFSTIADLSILIEKLGIESCLEIPFHSNRDVSMEATNIQYDLFPDAWVQSPDTERNKYSINPNSIFDSSTKSLANVSLSYYVNPRLENSFSIGFYSRSMNEISFNELDNISKLIEITSDLGIALKEINSDFSSGIKFSASCDKIQDTIRVFDEFISDKYSFRLSGKYEPYAVLASGCSVDESEYLLKKIDVINPNSEVLIAEKDIKKAEFSVSKSFLEDIVSIHVETPVEKLDDFFAHMIANLLFLDIFEIKMQDKGLVYSIDFDVNYSNNLADWGVTYSFGTLNKIVKWDEIINGFKIELLNDKKLCGNALDWKKKKMVDYLSSRRSVEEAYKNLNSLQKWPLVNGDIETLSRFFAAVGCSDIKKIISNSVWPTAE